MNEKVILQQIIDSCDDSLRDVFLRRMDIAVKMTRLDDDGESIYDYDREQEVLRHVTAGLSPELTIRANSLWRSLMRMTRGRQYRHVITNKPQLKLPHEKDLVDSDGITDGLVLCPIQYDQELPVCELKIEFLPKLLPYAAMTQSRQELSEESIIIGQDQQTARYSFHIAEGTVWDSHMADIYIVPAGSYGSYRLTSKYFTEAAEGWGAEFAKICGSFTCPLEESPNAEAEKVIMDFAEGFFSADQVAMLSSFYGDSKDLREVYTGDPSRVRLVTLDGMEYLDSRIESSGYAPISLTFRETEDADSYTYLSVKVVKTQAGYRISAYGLDK